MVFLSRQRAAISLVQICEHLFSFHRIASKIDLPCAAAAYGPLLALLRRRGPDIVRRRGRCGQGQELAPDRVQLGVRSVVDNEVITCVTVG